MLLFVSAGIGGGEPRRGASPGRPRPAGTITGDVVGPPTRARRRGPFEMMLEGGQDGAIFFLFLFFFLTGKVNVNGDGRQTTPPISSSGRPSEGAEGRQRTNFPARPVGRDRP